MSLIRLFACLGLTFAHARQLLDPLWVSCSPYVIPPRLSQLPRLLGGMHFRSLKLFFGHALRSLHPRLPRENAHAAPNWRLAQGGMLLTLRHHDAALQTADSLAVCSGNIAHKVPKTQSSGKKYLLPLRFKLRLSYDILRKTSRTVHLRRARRLAVNVDFGFLIKRRLLLFLHIPRKFLRSHCFAVETKDPNTLTAANDVIRVP